MITPIATIQADAERAARTGAPPADACPFPAASPQAKAWAEFYAAAADSHEAQVARYARAIGSA